ncbi:Gp19/Gp15/Gp42 family protein [Pseudoclavibacter terrae]|uniref:Phage protein Gp19/Gp15/Gp42 n=1 Tax=Pseudoclavibacter terrae TaxID=1530195 RepID=A0A7J5B7D6_9MICO|nr:Gp19/Gp15/Gp42 family protein [Pseudoclavibacter terrae]KAB1639863.1 hypothetical protein F8O03_06020 [Pseudoclavibacter terrae]
MPEQPFASVTDLEARWKTLTADERTRAAVLLGDASQLILDEVPRATDADPKTRQRIVCGIVKRAMSGPADGVGITSLQQGAGPFQATTQFANPTGDLYLTAADRRALGAKRQRAFEIDLLPLGYGGQE